MAVGHDVVAAALAWCAAFLLRFNLEIPQDYTQMMWRHLPWVVTAQAFVFWYFGLYRGIWRFASLPDLRRILVAVLVAAAGLTASLFMMRIAVPRSVLILAGIGARRGRRRSQVNRRACSEPRLAGCWRARR
jgi:FlaA1/EpsC-like NDP-sugar epimerase